MSACNAAVWGLGGVGERGAGVAAGRTSRRISQSHGSGGIIEANSLLPVTVPSSILTTIV